MKVQKNLSVEEETWEWITKIAAAKHRTSTQMVRLMVEQWVAAYRLYPDQENPMMHVFKKIRGNGEIKMKLRRRSISVDDETWAMIAGLAKALDRSTSDYVRIILKQHLKRLEAKCKEKEN